MMHKIPIAVPALLLVSVIVCLVLFRLPPKDSLWRGYTVLYVPIAVSEETTLKICRESGIDDIITETALELPLVEPLTKNGSAPFPVFSPAQAMDQKNSYFEKRHGFFTDKNNNYRLYYMSNSASPKTKTLLSRFRSSVISGSGVDISETYLWPIPAVVFLVFCLFLLLSKERLAVFTGGIPVLLFSFTTPQYPTGAAACLFLYSLFLLQKVWLRRGFVGHWFRKVYGPCFLVFGAVVCFSFSVQCGLLFLLSITGSISALLLVFLLPRHPKSAFSPVKIRPSALIPVVNANNLASAGIITGGIALLIVFSLFQTVFFQINSKNDLSFPAPTRYTDSAGLTANAFSELQQVREAEPETLPDLGHLITLVWNTMVFSYFPLNTPRGNLAPKPGDTVSIPVYSRIDSRIVESETPAYVFDDAFIADVLAAIENAGETQFEQVLKAQGRFATVSYSTLDARGNRIAPLLLSLLLAVAPPVTAHIIL
jgi:hypothetical protein